MISKRPGKFAVDFQRGNSNRFTEIEITLAMTRVGLEKNSNPVQPFKSDTAPMLTEVIWKDLERYDQFWITL